MLEFPRWKYFLILLVLAVSALYALPNVYQKDPSVQITASRVRSSTTHCAAASTVSSRAPVSPRRRSQKEGDSLMVRLPSLQAQTRANDVLRQQLGENYTVALNLASTVPDWLAKLGGRPMVLGLDLVGGVHFAMQVDQKAALEKRLDGFAEDIRTTLRDARIPYRSVERRADNSIQVNLGEGANADAARVTLAKAQPTLTYDVSGQNIAVKVPEAELKQIASGAIEQNLTTLRNRVNALGVSEPTIQRQGEDRIVVELPGLQDTAEAKRLIGATASLEFRAVVDGNADDAVRSGNIRRRPRSIACATATRRCC